jgi:hypothetical protein
MTAITHPLARTYRIVTIMITAAVLVGLSVVLPLVLTTAGSSTAVSHPVAARTPVASGLAGTVNSGPDNPSRVSSADELSLIGSEMMGHYVPTIPYFPGYVNGWSTRTDANHASAPAGTVNSGPDNPSRVTSR